MSRTYRNHPKGPFYRTHLNNEFDEPVTIRNWKEAKELLTKEAYGKARSRRGDSLTHEFACSSVPHWFRNETEKQYRQATKVELLRYQRLEDYELRLHDKPDSVEWWFWY